VVESKAVEPEAVEPEAVEPAVEPTGDPVSHIKGEEPTEVIGGYNRAGYELVPNVPRYLQEYSLPLGLVTRRGHKYKVIDGYHRIASRIAACPQARFMVIYCE